MSFKIPRTYAMDIDIGLFGVVLGSDPLSLRGAQRNAQTSRVLDCCEQHEAKVYWTGLSPDVQQ